MSRSPSSSSSPSALLAEPQAPLGAEAAAWPEGESAWRRILAPYKRAAWRPALSQLISSGLGFVVTWGLMLLSLDVSYALTLLLAIPAAGFFIRLFILQHDCGHGAFFPSRRANGVLGSILGVLTLFPYGYWKRTHAIHHATNGNLDEREFGDVQTRTVAEYRAMSRWGRFGYRLYRNPLVLLGVGPFYQFVVKHRFPWDIPFAWKREWRSVLWTNVGLLAVGGALCAAFGWRAVVAVEVPIILVAGAIGVFLFYVQHQFEETYWDRGAAWDFYRAGVEGSSFFDLPNWLHWWTGNIGYHHIHHLASTIPNYRLAAAFHENPPLQRVTRLSLGQSLGCLRLKLWDEASRRLVRFAELRSLASSAAAASSAPAPHPAPGPDPLTA